MKFPYPYRGEEVPLSVRVGVGHIYYQIGRDSAGEIEITTNDPSLRLDVPEIRKITEKRANELLKIYQKELKNYEIFRPREKLLAECKNDFIKLGFGQGLMEEIYEKTRRGTDFFICKENPLTLFGPLLLVKGGEFVQPGKVYRRGFLFRFSDGVINHKASIFIPKYSPLRSAIIKHEFKHALQFHLIQSLFDLDSKLYEEFSEKEKKLMKTYNLLKDKFKTKGELGKAFNQLVKEVDSIPQEGKKGVPITFKEKLKFISKNKDKLAASLMDVCYSVKYRYRAGANFESTATTPRGNAFYVALGFGVPTLILRRSWQAIVNSIISTGPYTALEIPIIIMGFSIFYLPSIVMIRSGYGNLLRYRRVKKLLEGKSELNKVLSYLLNENITL